MSIIKKKITLWIRQQVAAAKAEGVVLGLSGGIDSAVVAALAQEALGNRKVLALMLPCHSHKQDIADAKLVAGKLRLRTKAIDLSKTYDMFSSVLPKGNSLANANLKPRLRMLTLYYFANTLNYLVCGTGNKSELMVGYFTKHGDGATDILPIADLLKRQVKELAEELAIPEAIITKPPTAGLWPGQTDEGELGITYAELDDILDRKEHGRKQSASPEIIRKVMAMHARSAHKRQGPRICYI